MKASIMDLRCRMSEVLRAIDRNESVTLTHRGREKATIVPKQSADKVGVKSHPAFGLWEKRRDMDDVFATVRRIRKGRTHAV